jgi:hypothetical protein
MYLYTIVHIQYCHIMKTTCSIFLVIAFGLTMSCTKKSNALTEAQRACMEACDQRQAAIDAAYDACLDEARQVHDTQVDDCLEMTGDAKAACLQLARETLQRAIQNCKATRDMDRRNEIGCSGKCFLADPGPAGK